MSNFASGDLIAWVRPHRDLHTMKDFSCARIRSGLSEQVLRFAGASAAAELVLSHAEQETHSGLFDALEAALDELEGAPVERLPGTVLMALWMITEAFGFAPQLDPCVRCHTPLGADEFGRFDFAAGGLRCLACGEDAAGPRLGPIARRQLGSLIAGEIPDDLDHSRRHLGIVSDFISYHVVAKPLKSLKFLAGVLPPDAELPVV